MNLFRPFDLKVIAGKLADTLKLIPKLATGKYTSEEITAEVNRIRAKWGLGEL